MPVKHLNNSKNDSFAHRSIIDKEAVLFLIVLGLVTLLTLFQFIQCVGDGKCPVGGDFPLFYNAARYAAAGTPEAAYNIVQTKAWLAAPQNAGTLQPFVNPPFSLLLFYPLAFFTSSEGFIFWYGAQLLFLLAALRLPYAQQRLGTADFAGFCSAVAVLLPFALYSFMTGQSGMLCASLFLLVLAWRKSHPVLAGVALACACFKPQLFIVLPVLLFKERNWRALAWALVMLFFLVAVCIGLWGIAPWINYIATARMFSHLAKPEFVGGLAISSASPTLAMYLIGLGTHAAAIIQGIISLTVLAALWRCLGQSKEATLLLLLTTAAFLVSPYCFIYDTVSLSFACIVLVRAWACHRITTVERISLILLAFIPIVSLKIQNLHIPYSFLAIAFAFVAALWRSKTERSAGQDCALDASN